MKRKLRVHCPAISEITSGRLRGFARALPPLHALFSWGLIIVIALVMVSGCGRYKEELEGAKQQIQKLDAQVKTLTEETNRLKQEKSRLSDDLQALSDKNVRMQRQLDDLNKSKAALSAENSEIKKKNSAAEQEIASLKREKGGLSQEIEELKKRLAELTAPPKSPSPLPTAVGPQAAKPPEALSPCDAVLAFMKASEEIVRQQRGTERTRSLERIKQEYAPKMKGAPEKAINAAENWVKEGTNFWDKPSEDSTFRLLKLRNTVLDACGKSPDEAGFK
jgi:uncharacterized protein YoxC